MTGLEGAMATIRRLRILWISHKHGDHCLGAQAIIGKRNVAASSRQPGANE